MRIRLSSWARASERIGRGWIGQVFSMRLGHQPGTVAR
jgi:hypothetical protein